MPDVRADEIITRQSHRMFIQYGSARPTNKILYAGQGTQYVSVSALTSPESGGITPIWVPDPRRKKAYKLAGRTIAPPALAQATLVMRENHAGIPKQLTRIGCALNLYELSGNCGDLSDFLAGWSDYVLIYSAGLITDKNLGQRTAFDSDEPIEDQMGLTLSDVYPIGALGFGEGAAVQVDREVVDIVYASRASCGDCGDADDGSQRIFAITTSSGAGSPGLPAEVVYSLNGGLTWNETNITSFGASETPIAIDVAGKYVIVIGSAAYYYAELNQNTGVPGTWTKVTAGFVANKNPTDLYVLGPREIFFCGQGGYIYKCEDVPSGVSVYNAGSATTLDLTRISGYENTVVAVGASGAIIKSLNRGISWAATVTSPVALNTIRALDVLDDRRYWVGIDTIGRVYYTLNGGETWTERAFSGNGSGTVWDIIFPTDEVGYFSHSTTTPTARIFATWNGGADWTRDAPRMNGLPTFNRANRLAAPDADASVACNNLAVAGLSGGGTDGILIIGNAIKF